MHEGHTGTCVLKKIPGRVLFTGSSSNGWHWYETYRRCPRLFEIQSQMVNHDEDDQQKAGPLRTGTLAHLGLAHLYGRELPESKDLMSASDVIAYSCQDDAALEHQLQGMLSAYLDHWSDDSDEYRVVAVEKEYKTFFGAAPYSARIDLVLERKSDGKIWFVDHKSTGKLSRQVQKRYEMSGQMTGQYILGQIHFKSNFGGVILNHMQTDGQKFKREEWRPRPQHLAAFPGLIESTWRSIQSTEPKYPALSEAICITRYKPYVCELYDICYWRED
jgi:hypothetical protein